MREAEGCCQGNFLIPWALSRVIQLFEVPRTLAGIYSGGSDIAGVYRLTFSHRVLSLIQGEAMMWMRGS